MKWGVFSGNTKHKKKPNKLFISLLSSFLCAGGETRTLTP